MRRKQQSKKTSSVDFRMRLRFRVSTSFFSQEFKEEVVINGRQVILKSAVAEQPLNQARWLIAGVNGFANENDAREYGVRLKRAIQFASVKNRIGVDCGKDIPTSRWGSEVKDSLLEQSGKNLRDDVHGIDVFKNDGNSFYMGITAHGQALAGVEPFLQNLIHFYPWMDKVSPKIEQIVIMLNNVIMNPEPVARIVLAISTIEGLGQDQKLSEGQKKLLVHLANTASEATNISHEESVIPP